MTCCLGCDGRRSIGNQDRGRFVKRCDPRTRWLRDWLCIAEEGQELEEMKAWWVEVKAPNMDRFETVPNRPKAILL
jgi:hypothetical protein